METIVSHKQGKSLYNLSMSSHSEILITELNHKHTHTYKENIVIISWQKINLFIAVSNKYFVN